MKKTSLSTWVVVILLGAGLAVALASKHDVSNTNAAAATPIKPKKPTARDRQLQAAGAVALTLRRAAKDPEAFELKSAVVHQDGVACYEYRAKNSFGAMFPGEAVMRADGKVLVHETHGNAFVSAWNKLCTRPGGDDIAPYLHQNGLI